VIRRRVGKEELQGGRRVPGGRDRVDGTHAVADGRRVKVRGGLLAREVAGRFRSGQADVSRSHDEHLAGTFGS